MRTRFTLTLVFILLASQLVVAQDRPIHFSGGMGYSDLFSLNEDGSGLQRLTNRESRGEYQPQVSPDGKYVVFNTYRFGGWKLAIAELQDGKIKRGSIRKLVKSLKGYEYDANWSADGESIVYIGFTSGNSGYRQLFVTDPSGREVRQLTNTSSSHYAPSFSEDGKHIYFQAIEGEAYRLKRMNIESGEIKLLTERDNAHEIAPGLSPDGSRLAFYRIHLDESVTVHVFDLEAKTDKLIYGEKDSEKSFLNRAWETPLFSYAIGWSKDSKRFVFTRHLGDSVFELYLTDITTGKTRQITQLKEASTQPSWY